MAVSSPRKQRIIRIIRRVLHSAYRVSPRLAGRLCYKVLTTPPRHVAEPEEVTFIAEGKQEFIEVNGLKAAVYNWPGDGPNVLLVHGWDSYSGRWFELGRRLLAAGCNVFAIDAPAHGATKGGVFSVIHFADLLAAYVDVCRPELLVGHSAGGMASIYYPEAYPTAFRPKKIALLGTPAELSDFVESFRRIIGLRPEIIRALETEFIRRWKNSFAYFSMARFAKQLNMPGLIAHDKTDDIASYMGAYAIAESWPQAELMITEGMGHGLQTEEVWAKVVALVN